MKAHMSSKTIAILLFMAMTSISYVIQAKPMAVGIKKLLLPKNISPKSMLICSSDDDTTCFQTDGTPIVRVSGNYDKESILYNTVVYSKLGEKNEIGSIVDSNHTEIARLSAEQTGENVRLVIIDATPDLQHVIGYYCVNEEDNNCFDRVRVDFSNQPLVYWDIADNFENMAKEIQTPYPPECYIRWIYPQFISDDGLTVFGHGSCSTLNEGKTDSILIWRREDFTREFILIHKFDDLRLTGVAMNNDGMYLLCDHWVNDNDDSVPWVKIVAIQKNNTVTMSTFEMPGSIGYWIDRNAKFFLVDNDSQRKVLLKVQDVTQFNGSAAAIPYLDYPDRLFSASPTKNNMLENNLVLNPIWVVEDNPVSPDPAAAYWSGDCDILLELMAGVIPMSKFYSIRDYWRACHVDADYLEHLITLVFDVKKEQNGYISFYAYGINNNQDASQDVILRVTIDPDDCQGDVKQFPQ